MVASIRIADFEITALSDGTLRTSLDNLIGMDRGQAEDLVGGTDAGWFFIPVNNFLVQHDRNAILIDAGAGNTMQPTLGQLPANLRVAGIDPSSITHVVLTHIHPDHANGLIDDAGTPHYPNAELIVPEKEAAFWLGPPPGEERENVRRNRARARINIEPYAARMRRIGEGEEVLGLTAMPAPGHTPGHTCWRIGEGKETLVAWGDLVHFSAIQISHPETAVTYDLDKDLARATRLRLLDMIATERLMIAGAHVAAPGMGHVVRRNGRYAFEPLRNVPRA